MLKVLQKDKSCIIIISLLRHDDCAPRMAASAHHPLLSRHRATRWRCAESQWCAGVQGTHMKGVVGGGRKEVSACIGRKGVEEAYQLESSWAWHFWWIILLLLQLDVDHNLLLLLLDQLLPLLHSIMNYSYTNTVSFPGKPEVTKGWWQFWWLLVAVSQTRRTINTSVLAANYGATRHREQYTEHLDNAVTRRR